MDRAIPSAFAGNAGEFFVLAELTRRGWTAAMTARNTRSYDILAKRDDEFVAVRVKTKTPITDAFQWNAKKSGEIFLDISQDRDFCALVDIPQADDLGPTYYIVPTPIVDQWLRDDFHVWATTPGARRQQRDASTARRLFYLDDDTTKLAHGYRQKLARYRGAWETLAKRQQAIEQLELLAQEAGLDLVELIHSGMTGKQLLEYVVDKHKQVRGRQRRAAQILYPGGLMPLSRR